MSQTSVTQSARKAFGNVSNVKASFGNTVERGKVGLVSNNGIASLTKDCLKKPKDLMKNGKAVDLSASCKKVSSDKVGKQVVTKALKEVSKKSSSCVKKEVIKLVVDSKPIADEDQLESFYPMPQEDIDDLSDSPLGRYEHEIEFEEEPDIPSFMKQPFNTNLDLDLLSL